MFVSAFLCDLFIGKFKLYVQCKLTKKEVAENADTNIQDSVRYKTE